MVDKARHLIDPLDPGALTDVVPDEAQIHELVVRSAMPAAAPLAMPEQSISYWSLRTITVAFARLISRLFGRH